MKILVTGGAGFIASHVADRYRRDGHAVHVLDDLSTGHRRNLSPESPFHLLDIRDHAAVDELLARERFDVINHHAAQMDVRKSTEDPVYDAQVNILGSVGLILSAAKHKVKKFIYISTGGAVYGEPRRVPVEEGDAVNPECPYGISKHTVEHYLYLYRMLAGLDYTVLRYPNVYGPRQSPHGEAGVIAIFSGLMLQGQTPTIFGDGSQVRDYVFVGDVAAANALALDKAGGEIINLGSECGTSVLELYRHLQPLTGFQGAPKLAPKRPGEIQAIFLSGKKARQVLGWTPTVGVPEGLRQTVDWVKSVAGGGPWRT